MLTPVARLALRLRPPQVQRMRYQPRWLRHQEVRRKRAMGPPCGGPCSIVVTDMEGYSEMMSASPQLMAKVMALHNTVMKKAAEQHGGSIIGQVRHTQAGGSGGVGVCCCGGMGRGRRWC